MFMKNLGIDTISNHSDSILLLSFRNLDYITYNLTFKPIHCYCAFEHIKST